MQELTRADLYSLETYTEIRQDFKAKVMAHKKDRRLPMGPHAALYFEDRLTMQYQVQEMLRVERIFEPEGIEEELAAYNPLVPDGANWKATFMLEYVDIEERRQALEQMLGIEDRVWVRVEGFEPVWAIADEDLERDTAEKTSSVHFLRFEFTPAMVAAMRAGTGVAAGIDHDAYRQEVDPLPDNVLKSLLADLD